MLVIIRLGFAELIPIKSCLPTATLFGFENIEKIREYGLAYLISLNFSMRSFKQMCSCDPYTTEDEVFLENLQCK